MDMSTKRSPSETLPIARFKATCLAVLEQVRSSGRPVLVTKRGVPIAEVVPPPPASTAPDWLGALRGSAQLKDDLVAPASAVGDWDALRS